MNMKKSPVIKQATGMAWATYCEVNGVENSTISSVGSAGQIL